MLHQKLSRRKTFLLFEGRENWPQMIKNLRQKKERGKEVWNGQTADIRLT